MKPEDHAAALAASLTAAIDTIQEWLGHEFLDDTWQSALTEYEWSLEPKSEEPFHHDMIRSWESTSALFRTAGLDAPRPRVCASMLRAIAERLSDHDDVYDLLRQEAMRAEGRA